jgi:hypothetical protein
MTAWSYSCEEWGVVLSLLDMEPPELSFIGVMGGHSAFQKIVIPAPSISVGLTVKPYFS